MRSVPPFSILGKAKFPFFHPVTCASHPRVRFLSESLRQRILDFRSQVFFLMRPNHVVNGHLEFLELEKAYSKPDFLTLEFRAGVSGWGQLKGKPEILDRD